MLQVYITKHALTKGIQKIEVEELNMGMVKTLANFPEYFHKEGKEWHKTLEDAIKKAEEMRLKKIASLKKSLLKMEKLKF